MRERSRAEHHDRPRDEAIAALVPESGSGYIMADVTVQDTGRGVAADQLASIFETFVQSAA
jgi:signal transduction histidine kinase